MNNYDVLIVGTGPAGLGAAFGLLEDYRPKAGKPNLSILIIDKNEVSSGGLRNDCKMNFSWPIGFPEVCWDKEMAEGYIRRVEDFLLPAIMEKKNVGVYFHRAEKLGVKLLEIRQSHLGTDGGLELIKSLLARLGKLGAEISLGEKMTGFDAARKIAKTDKREIAYKNLIIAPGRGGFSFLQDMMNGAGISYRDNVVDIGLRIETKEERYPIVRDYYDPKFLFPKKTRTFCTNSRSAYVVQEKYGDKESGIWYSVNGHAWSASRPENGLTNFAILKTVTLTAPLASGQSYARMLGMQAALLGGGRPIMQRVGDFRLGKRSFAESFTGDLYDFEPTLPSCTPGDIALSAPAKILNALWNAMKLLDSIVPGLLHPSTIMYYPEIKLYANRPAFADDHFMAAEGLYLVGDGAGTSRGITAAWASGLRAADGILASL
ncbi:MAG: pyridine nucleotide-disulfide oxidoreductase [Spirochaetales bacterium]